MTWFRVDDTLADHRKVRRLGSHRLPAMGLWVLAGSWVGLNDNEGFVPDEVIHRWDPRRRLAKKLVEVGLWERAEVASEPGYQFHDWHDMQLSMEEIEKKRAHNRERQRRFRLRRAGLNPTDPGPGTTPTDAEHDEPEPGQDDDGSDGVTATNGHAVSNALRAPLVTPPRPDPTRPVTTYGDLGGGAADPNVHERPRPHDPACDKPCHICRDARLAAERAATTATERKTNEQTERARRRKECPSCDDFGWVLGPDRRPTEPARRCKHLRLVPAATEVTA